MSTERDKAILNSILNPFFPVGGDFDIEDPSALNDAIGEMTNEILEAKRIEKEAIVLAEEEKILDAIKALSKAIEMAPQLPSLYNNRAQAYRLNNDITNAMNDLNTAILLSGGFGRSACQAFCQRGLILKKNGEEEKAMEDLKKAAELGSPFAKMILVQSNPYAALCNKMLSQVMEKLTKVLTLGYTIQYLRQKHSGKKDVGITVKIAPMFTMLLGVQPDVNCFNGKCTLPRALPNKYFSMRKITTELPSV